MRIVHVTDFYLPRLGGIETHVHDLAWQQYLAGHDVEILTSSPGPADEGPKTGGPLVHRINAPGRASTALRPGVLQSGRALLRAGRYDVVHVHAGPVSPLAFAAMTLASGTATVVTAHSLLGYLQPAFRLLDGVVGWSRWPVTWTAVSEVAAAPLRRLVAPAPVHVLPNGIDIARWRAEPLPRDRADVLVVAVMRLAARKRPGPMLRMLRHAQRDLGGRAQLRGVIAGEGSLRPRLDRYLRRHEMTGWVSLSGRLTRPEIAALYARADMFVAPATLESFGIAALEARCAGLPVVARAQGGIAEFITDGREGLLAHSDAEMTAAIIRLAADPGLRTRIAAHNRATMPPLAWPDVLRTTIGLYELAIATRGALTGLPA